LDYRGRRVLQVRVELVYPCGAMQHCAARKIIYSTQYGTYGRSNRKKFQNRSMQPRKIVQLPKQDKKEAKSSSNNPPKFAYLKE
jgi:hypothetical protein